MKTFLTILLLFSTSLLAKERLQIRKVNKEVLEINAMRANKTTLCDSFTSSVDKSVCNSGMDLILKQRVETLLGGYSSDFINKASEDLDKEVKEEKCVANLQKEFTDCGWTFNGSETCNQLKIAERANGACNAGSGSGSGV